MTILKGAWFVSAASHWSCLFTSNENYKSEITMLIGRLESLELGKGTQRCLVILGVSFACEDATECR